MILCKLVLSSGKLLPSMSNGYAVQADRYFQSHSADGLSTNVIPSCTLLEHTILSDATLKENLL